MVNLELRVLQAASEAFGNKLPDTWEGMTEQEQNDWLDTNRCDKFEHLSTDQYFSLIDCHSYTIKNVLKDTLERLKASLVTMACNDEIPLDFNELNLMNLVEEACETE